MAATSDDPEVDSAVSSNLFSASVPSLQTSLQVNDGRAGAELAIPPLPDLPWETSLLLSITEACQWTRPHRPRRPGLLSWPVSVLLSMSVSCLLLASAIMGARGGDDPSSLMLRLLVFSYFGVEAGMQIAAFGVVCPGLGEVVRALPPVRLHLHLCIFAALTFVTVGVVAVDLPLVWSGDVKDFGPLAQGPFVAILWFVAALHVSLGGYAVCGLLATCSMVLEQDLRETFAAMERRESAEARRLYGRFIAHLRLVLPVYQKVASAPIMYSILCLGIVISQEVYAAIGRPAVLHSRWWGALCVVCLLWVAGPATVLPPWTQRLARLASQHACQAERVPDLETLVSVFGALNKQAGLRIGGHVVSRSFLLTCLSLSSAVASGVTSMVGGSKHGTSS